MERYLTAGDFVHQDGVRLRSAPEGAYDRPSVLLEGEIGCRGQIVITVRKRLEILERLDGDAIVETRSYSYNVSLRGEDNVFRYDNGHPDFLYPGHRDAHHKHVYDLQTGEEVSGSPIWVGADGWPHLSDVIDEARDW